CAGATGKGGSSPPGQSGRRRPRNAFAGWRRRCGLWGASRRHDRTTPGLFPGRTLQQRLGLALEQPQFQAQVPRMLSLLLEGRQGFSPLAQPAMSLPGLAEAVVSHGEEQPVPWLAPLAVKPHALVEVLERLAEPAGAVERGAVLALGGGVFRVPLHVPLDQ